MNSNTHSLVLQKKHLHKKYNIAVKIAQITRNMMIPITTGMHHTAPPMSKKIEKLINLPNFSS